MCNNKQTSSRSDSPRQIIRDNDDGLTTVEIVFYSLLFVGAVLVVAVALFKPLVSKAAQTGECINATGIKGVLAGKTYLDCQKAEEKYRVDLENEPVIKDRFGTGTP